MCYGLLLALALALAGLAPANAQTVTAGPDAVPPAGRDRHLRDRPPFVLPGDERAPRRQLPRTAPPLRSK
jgi:hypothetical protein